MYIISQLHWYPTKQLFFFSTLLALSLFHAASDYECCKNRCDSYTDEKRAAQYIYRKTFGRWFISNGLIVNVSVSDSAEILHTDSKLIINTFAMHVFESTKLSPTPVKILIFQAFKPKTLLLVFCGVSILTCVAHLSAAMVIDSTRLMNIWKLVAGYVHLVFESVHFVTRSVSFISMHCQCRWSFIVAKQLQSKLNIDSLNDHLSTCTSAIHIKIIVLTTLFPNAIHTQRNNR